MKGRTPVNGHASLRDCHQRPAAASSGSRCNSVIIALLEIAYIPKDIHLFPGTGGTVTFRARDGEAELTGTYSQRVTGSPVRKAHRR